MPPQKIPKPKRTRNNFRRNATRAKAKNKQQTKTEQKMKTYRNYRGAGFTLAGTFLVMLASLLLCFTASAQRADGFTDVGCPVVIQAGMTTNFVSPPLIYCGDRRNIAFQLEESWNLPCDAAGANTNIAYTLAPSVDLVHFDTNKTWTITGYGRQTVAGQVTYTTTNVDTLGYRGFYILSAVNASVSGIATNRFKVSVKLGAQ
jgi:hypothetical protein